MGYQRQPKQFNLKFADPEYSGFECRVKSLDIGGFLSLTETAQSASSTAEDSAKAIRSMLAVLSENLVSWNLESADGTPVPATLDELLRQDTDFAMALIMAWMGGMGGVPVPLPSDSSAGETSLVPSIPMEPL